MASRRYAIIGDGAAGMTAAETRCRLDPAGEITVVADDPHPTYLRPLRPPAPVGRAP